MRTFFLLAGLAALVALPGCSDTTSTNPATAATQALPQEKGHDEGHDHSAGKMMISHLGKYHGKLTAHLSAKGGNELDLFVETIDNPTPVALPTLKLTGVARRGAEEFPLTFEPAPADERPKGEAAGSCSHFVAKAAFLKPDDTLTVVVEAELDGRQRKCTWKNFEVAKFTHAAE